jgi:hypothetical protein
MSWKKLGVIVAPQADIFWMASHVGPSFVQEVDGKLEVWITGRDTENVSRKHTYLLKTCMLN